MRVRAGPPPTQRSSLPGSISTLPGRWFDRHDAFLRFVSERGEVRRRARYTPELELPAAEPQDHSLRARVMHQFSRMNRPTMSVKDCPDRKRLSISKAVRSAPMLWRSCTVFFRGSAATPRSCRRAARRSGNGSRADAADHNDGRQPAPTDRSFEVSEIDMEAPDAHVVQILDMDRRYGAQLGISEV